MVSRALPRFPLMALGMVSLRTGLWAGLLRLGWDLPSVPPSLPDFHGPFMISGFRGLLAVLFSPVEVGLRYDAVLHTIFLGFVFAMIFAHAPKYLQL